MGNGQDVVLDPEAYPAEPSIVGSLMGGSDEAPDEKTKDH